MASAVVLVPLFSPGPPSVQRPLDMTLDASESENGITTLNLLMAGSSKDQRNSLLLRDSLVALNASIILDSIPSPYLEEMLRDYRPHGVRAATDQLGRLGMAPSFKPLQHTVCKLKNLRPGRRPIFHRDPTTSREEAFCCCFFFFPLTLIPSG
ncbi:hypothetical protein B0T20DRAFT_60476 [Sordaria brevicollis]|uniref:Uncharacterized protein n=1 Tax=Sordaria brevicollis TaxID=83679 RepID=A0AAE0P3D9_SORBR|nr:hypothetical protein B0T20DRAFT_60476 [Sordaria brevicollis]